MNPSPYSRANDALVEAQEALRRAHTACVAAVQDAIARDDIAAAIYWQNESTRAVTASLRLTERSR